VKRHSHISETTTNSNHQNGTAKFQTNSKLQTVFSGKNHFFEKF